MPRIVIGLDFGTSNTSVSYADLDNPVIKTAILEKSENGTECKSMPSAMFYIPELNKLLVGRQAINAYINHDYEGRLLRNLKSILDDIDATTRINNLKEISYFSFIYNFLNRVKKRVIEEAGSDNIVGIVVGRPVHFFDDDDERDKKAEQNLRRIVEKLGFQNIVFLEEPIAASFALEAEISSDSNAFVADLGGGTSDFTAMALGPSHAKKTNRRDDVFATTGIKIGGTNFDKSFSLSRFMPELGFESEILLENGTISTFPRIYFDNLSNAFSINKLYNYTVIHDIENFYQKSLAKKKIEDLLRIIRAENGHNLIIEIEKCKKHLSLEEKYVFNKKNAFAIPTDSYMQEDILRNSAKEFISNTESFLSKTNTEIILNKIKTILRNYKDQYINGNHDYNFLFRENTQKDVNIERCIADINSVIFDKLNLWMNELSFNDIKSKFENKKDIINSTNYAIINKNINDYSYNLKLDPNFKLKFTFQPDYSIGYDIFDNLLKIKLESVDIDPILIKMKNIIVSEKAVENNLKKEITVYFGDQYIQNLKKACEKTGEDFYKKLVAEYKNKYGIKKLEQLREQIVDAEYYSKKTMLISYVMKNIFVSCSILDKTDVLLQNIRDFIYASELSLFNLPTQSELVEIAKKSGIIYEDTIINRQEFENSIQEYIPKLQQSIKDCISKSGKNKSDFQYLIMTGGSSRIPMIRESIKSCFDKDIKIVCENLSEENKSELEHDTPDAIAKGLCVHALNIFK